MHRFDFTPRRQAWAAAALAALLAHGGLAWTLLRRPAPLVVRKTPALVAATVRLTPHAEPSPPLPQAKPPRDASLARRAAVPIPSSDVPEHASPAPQTAPALSWQYELIQGGKRGVARLQWRPADGQYEAVLERELDGRTLPSWRSQGELNEIGGLEPRRFALRRTGKKGTRDSQATNFRRDEGLISYSASPALHPLADGAQDRISWWLQLAALVAAEPDRYQPGNELEMPVAGLRGELNTWRFIVRRAEPMELAVGTVARTLLFERLPQGPYDARIEVWLDPGRHYLPVRVRYAQGDEVRWELLLASDQPAEP